MTKTFAQIKKQIEQLQKQADQLRKKEADGVRDRIQEAITVYGFSAGDFDFGGTRKNTRDAKQVAGKRSSKPKSKVAAASVKYKDDQGNTWGGRGPRPAWFKAALEAGKTEQELAV
jgi:DNA-binding protein H-NS